MNRFKLFKSNYNDAIKDIKLMLMDDDPATQHILNWLIETEHNTYGIFCDAHWAHAMTTAEGFSSLAHNIHHALVDDGDICFPVINRCPKIAFVSQHDTDVMKYLLRDYEKRSHILPEPTVTFLKDVFEFTKAHDEFEVADLKRCFLSDAVRFDVSFAMDHYGNKKGFNRDWIDEVESAKEKYKRIFGKGVS